MKPRVINATMAIKNNTFLYSRKERDRGHWWQEEDSTDEGVVHFL